MYHLDEETQTALARERAGHLRSTMLAGRPARDAVDRGRLERAGATRISAVSLVHRLAGTRRAAL